jgi:glutamate dehydrogenase/leucine dehydrogenase
MSDSSGTVHIPDGMTREHLDYVMELKNERRGRIREFADEFGLDYLEGANPWSIPCKLAFPSATQNEISEDDARTLLDNGCIAVCEGANMPTSYEAVKLFENAKILFGPAKAANAGGVAISGLEMTQNSMRLSWTRDEVDNKLKNIMQSIHEKCVRYGENGEWTDYLQGANIAGFVKVADAMMAYGVV